MNIPRPPCHHLCNGDKNTGWPPVTLLQTGPDVFYHPAQLRKNHPVPRNWTHFTSWMQSGGWGASSRWIIWLKRWLSVVLATRSTANSHFIWSPLCCSNHIFPGPAASQEMETKQQMIHISSKEAKKGGKKETICCRNCHQPLSPWPELLPHVHGWWQRLPRTQGLSSKSFLSKEKKRRGGKNGRRERRGEESLHLLSTHYESVSDSASQLISCNFTTYHGSDLRCYLPCFFYLLIVCFPH